MAYTRAKSLNSAKLHKKSITHRWQWKENAGRVAFTLAAIICIVSVVAIFAFLIVKSVPAFQKIGVFQFLFGKLWSPDRLDTFQTQTLSGTYGIATMIVGSLIATVGALLVGGVLGYFTAVFLVFFCPKKLQRILSTCVHLLAGIPSVVYGFFGIVFLLPVLATIAPNNGNGLLATSLILGVMILPTVVSLSKTSLEAVAIGYYAGSLALGSTHTQAVFKAVVPAARSGITASLVLGIGRALGETMAVVMVAGNAPTFPAGLFGSFRVMTANIVMEMGYAGQLQESALVATGVVLLVLILLVNLLLGSISARAVKNTKEKKVKQTGVGVRIRDFFGGVAHKMKTPYIGRALAITAGAFSVFSLSLVVGFIFVKGIPTLVRTPSILYRKFEFAGDKVTIFPAIVATVMAILLSLVIAVPIGVMTAVFLNEYARKNNVFVRLVRKAIDVLGGVPSIVYGLFGVLTFVQVFGGHSSVIAGSLTVSIMLLPTIVRATEESLKSVADTLRAGSFALGAGKLRTIFKIVLPSALPGILSATILSMGRVVSESAPFLYTMGSVISVTPKSYMDSGATLAVALYQLAGEGWHVNEAYATAVVLIVFVFVLTLLAERIVKKLHAKMSGEKK